MVKALLIIYLHLSELSVLISTDFKIIKIIKESIDILTV